MITYEAGGQRATRRFVEVETVELPSSPHDGRALRLRHCGELRKTLPMASVPLKRGDVVFVDLRGALGAEKQKTRPCLVVQNDTGNKFSPTTIVAPVTDRPDRAYPMQVPVAGSELGPQGKDSIIACDQLRTIDRDVRIDSSRGVIATLSAGTMSKVDAALRISVGL